MPQRFLRPGLITSKRWDAVSWQAQSFYIRLLTLVDDFGRYEADPTLLRSHAFPLRDDVRSSRVTELCEEIAKAGLVTFYRLGDKEYLQIDKWQERARSETSKFPECNGSPRLYVGTQESAAERSGPPLPSSSSSINSHKSKRESNAREPKRLHGIPGSVEEVIDYGAKLFPPIAEDKCRKFWRHYEGQARTSPSGDVFWITSGEAVITNWKLKLPDFDGYEKGTASPRGRAHEKPTPEILPVPTELT